MSKIAKKPINIPENTKCLFEGNLITIEGPKGKLSLTKKDFVKVKEESGKLLISTTGEDSRPMSGTIRAILSNMIEGVSKGWEKKLKLIGVGYRAKADAKNLELTVGFSHPVKYPIPEGVTITTPSQTEILINGVDKQQIGQIASEIRSVRPPEPYKGKGIRYEDERVVKKEAKKK